MGHVRAKGQSWDIVMSIFLYGCCRTYQWPCIQLSTDFMHTYCAAPSMERKAPWEHTRLCWRFTVWKRFLQSCFYWGWAKLTSFWSQSPWVSSRWKLFDFFCREAKLSDFKDHSLEEHAALGHIAHKQCVCVFVPCAYSPYRSLSLFLWKSLLAPGSACSPGKGCEICSALKLGYIPKKRQVLWMQDLHLFSNSSASYQPLIAGKPNRLENGHLFCSVCAS